MEEWDDGGNVDLMYSLDLEPIVHAAAALNRELTLVSHKDRVAVVGAIKDTIAHGRPATAFGVFGPPEIGIVTGYDRGGDVLYGCSYFDNPSDRYCQRTDWFDRADWAGDFGRVIVGDKKRCQGPMPKETLISTLKWAIDLDLISPLPEQPNHASGVAVYDA